MGVDPVLMLTGPIEVTKKLLDRKRMRLNDIDLVESNEAFCISRGCLGATDADLDRVNTSGGAIALGHPTRFDWCQACLNQYLAIHDEIFRESEHTSGGLMGGPIDGQHRVGHFVRGDPRTVVSSCAEILCLLFCW